MTADTPDSGTDDGPVEHPEGPDRGDDGVADERAVEDVPGSPFREPASRDAASESDGASPASSFDENGVVVLAYLFGFPSGLAVYLTADGSDRVRFHGAQSMVLSVTVFALFFGLSAVSAAVLALASYADAFPIDLVILAGITLTYAVYLFASAMVWVYAMVSANRGDRAELPWISASAEKLR